MDFKNYAVLPHEITNNTFYLNSQATSFYKCAKRYSIQSARPLAFSKKKNDISFATKDYCLKMMPCNAVKK